MKKIFFLLLIFSKITQASNEACISYQNDPYKSNQSFSFGKNINQILLLNIVKDNKSEYSTIDYMVSNKLQFEFKDSDIGHQGIALEDINNKSITFWTSAKNRPSSAIRFTTDINGKLISKKIIKTLNNYDYNSNDSMPTITPDKKFIFFRGRKSPRDMYIRRYNLQDLIIESTNQNTQTPFIDFNISPSNLQYPDGKLRPLQSIATDYKYLYILYGNARINKKAIFTYTFDGTLVKTDQDILIGVNNAINDSKPSFYEPEGLSFSSEDRSIYILFTSGIAPNKIERIYKYN